MIRRIFPILISFLLLGTPAWAKLNVVATLPWIGSLAGELGQGSDQSDNLGQAQPGPPLCRGQAQHDPGGAQGRSASVQRSGPGNRLSSRAGRIIPESENPAGKSRFSGLFPIHRGPGPTGTGRPEHGGRPPSGESSLSSLSKEHLPGGRRHLPQGFPPSTRPGKLSTSTNLLLSETGWPQNRRNGKNVLGGEKIPSLS